MNLWFRLVRVVLAALIGRGCDPMDVTRLVFRVAPTDLDMNRHVTNSRYLSFMDLGRTDLMLRSGLARLALQRRWSGVVGGSMAEFRASLHLFDRLELSTRVRGWDTRWIYVEHEVRSGGRLACRAVVRAAFLEGGRIVAPEEVARLGGFHGRAGAVPASWQAAWDGFRCPAE